MSRRSKPPTAAPHPGGVEVLASGDTVLVSVFGHVDEHFKGFGSLGEPKNVILDVSAITRMTSFGVRQWLKAMEMLPKTTAHVYLLGCPTFFVDQLNMVLNFGGNAEVLTVMAPFVCTGCGIDSGELIDVASDRVMLSKGNVPEKTCSKCKSKLELDETPQSYFSFVSRHAATSVDPAAAALLAAQGLYTASTAADSGDKPPRIIKIVHGSVTYFRVIGTIGSMFRARPFLVGAEGEIVLDLAEVERFDAMGLREWRRLLKSLSSQVPAITLVDVGESLLAIASETLSQARNVSVWSVLMPYRCTECSRTRAESMPLAGKTWPYQLEDQVCPTCGGLTRTTTTAAMLGRLQKVSTDCPPDSAKLIARRDEVLSRALTDANVAQAGEGATASIGIDDMILGKYKIVRRLSSGGMAEVFLANQIGIGGFEKPVALKRIQRKLLDKRHLAIDMFLNEAKIAGRLTHPNIVQVLDVGEVGGALYLAMEYVHGRDLREVIKHLQIRKTTMPLGEACFIVREVAQALHHAYWSTDLEGNRLSVVHRDVSPHNIILGYDGTVKLLDFGVALSAVTEQEESMIVGKWMYMSPEATTNQKVDHRSDLFSLGVIIYLLWTGTLPFTGSNPKDIVRKIRAGEYKPLSECAPDLPKRFTGLVAQLLAPNPADRPQTGLEVVNALSEITRSYGIDSSPPDLAYLLATLFPDMPELSVVEVPAWRDSSPSLKHRPSASMSSSLSRSPSPLTRRTSLTPTPLAEGLSMTQAASEPAATVIDPPREFEPEPEPPRVAPRPPIPRTVANVPVRTPPVLAPVPEPVQPPIENLRPRYALVTIVVLLAILVTLVLFALIR